MSEDMKRYWRSVGIMARDAARQKNPFVNFPAPTEDAARLVLDEKRDAWWQGFDSPVP